MKVGCNVIINPASTYKVQLTDGTKTVTNVLARCGNFLLLGQMSDHVARRQNLHMNATYNPAGNVICLDKLLSPSNLYNVIVRGTTVI